MCDGETQFHFNFVDKRVFVFCGSNHLRSRRPRLLQRTAFCILRLQQTYHWILFEIFVGGNFLITQGNWHNSKINRKPYSYQLPTYWNLFAFLDWKVVEFWTVFFFSLNSFLQEVPIADQEKFEKFEKMQTKWNYTPTPPLAKN